MSRAAQGSAIAVTGLGLFTGVGIYLFKEGDSIVIGMAIGLAVALFGFIYARKGDEWARSRESKLSLIHI